jgi:hypothetical protein
MARGLGCLPCRSCAGPSLACDINHIGHSIRIEYLIGNILVVINDIHYYVL